MNKSWLVRGIEAGERARRRMQLTGVTPNGYRLWSPEEVEPVVTHCPDYQSIWPRVRARTRTAVYNKASRLGVNGQGARPWSDNEILRLRRVYPSGSRSEVLAAFPGRTYLAVGKAANSRGIYKAKAPIAPTGIRLLDQLLSRARTTNTSMAELDKLARSRTYFQKRRWRQQMDDMVHYRAARGMGGTLRAAFE